MDEKLLKASFLGRAFKTKPPEDPDAIEGEVLETDTVLGKLNKFEMKSFSLHLRAMYKADALDAEAQPIEYANQAHLAAMYLTIVWGSIMTRTKQRDPDKRLSLRRGYVIVEHAPDELEEPADEALDCQTISGIPGDAADGIPSFRTCGDSAQGIHAHLFLQNGEYLCGTGYYSKAKARAAVDQYIGQGLINRAYREKLFLEINASPISGD